MVVLERLGHGMGRRFPGVTLDRGRYYWVRRVPRELSGLILGSDGQPVQQVRVALRTDSLTEANRKAAAVSERVSAEWDAMASGRLDDARAHYLAARRLAAARGFAYVPLASLADPAQTSAADLVSRILSISDDRSNPAVVSAVLGGAPVTLPRMSEVWPEVQVLSEAENRNKSAAQVAKWISPRDRSIGEWVQVTGDPPIDQITRTHALNFRQWWSDRVTRDGLTPQYANKTIGHLSAIWTTYTRAHDLDMPNPFRKLALKGETENRRPPFSIDWLRDKLLGPGALDGLNQEARDVLLVMVNTGARPSEITDAPASDWHTEHEIPHLVIAAHGRELKVGHTARDIPLLGVSLDAARRIAKAGGCSRYHHKAAGWSALVNKYLRTHGLNETPTHTAYSLRHSVEDRLLLAGVDDRVRADILGHDYKRPRYGDGGALEGRRRAIDKIAL